MVMMIREMEAREEAREERREEERQEGAMAERERVALNMLRESGPAISVSFIPSPHKNTRPVYLSGILITSQ